MYIILRSLDSFRARRRTEIIKSQRLFDVLSPKQITIRNINVRVTIMRSGRTGEGEGHVSAPYTHNNTISY